MNIKDKVLHMALAEPFATVQEIADAVGTSNKYVRTVLSEAGISLLALRRERYRKLERMYQKLKEGE